jgi:DUF2075 family protein
VKNGVDTKTIREYVLNTYAVLHTRAIEGTYVHVSDNNLKNI